MFVKHADLLEYKYFFHGIVSFFLDILDLLPKFYDLSS